MRSSQTGNRPRLPPAASPWARSHKTARWALATAIGASAGWGCASRRPAAPPPDPNPPPLTADPDDWGADWDRVAHERARAATSAPSVWGIVLATFPADAHPDAAATLIGELDRIDPQLTDAWSHHTGNGWLVVYGRYDSPEDEAAQAGLRWVKELKVNDRPAFPRAMLTRIKLATPGARFHPYDLMSARLRYPTVEPLYTLQIGVWGDFESGALTLDEIHQRCEDNVRRLRAQGYEAYYYHDDDQRISTVSIGLFDRTAIDPRTGMYSPAVAGLLRQFPAHLVNGETLLEPVDGRRPQRGTRIQKPQLVQVPKL